MRREEDVQLKAAKRGFREAEAEGSREEEARWANVIGDILKRRGEYVEALRWLRRDYEISTKHLPQKQLLPTCQSLGEVYFRLERFKEALTYQKKHLQLAKESEDLIEQQRACTQLGRTYHEIFLKSEDDHCALQNAKKYFKAAMKLAKTLKEKQSYNKSSLFLKEFIDAYNNLGMLEKDLDNLEESRKILLQGLKICDDEEIDENDDARTRLHHNLGGVFLELRQWCKAKEHIEKDITICRNIDHPEGEAKGFINLGELHYRMQNYEDAIHCYQKAFKIASSMQDEDALVHQINQNIDTAKEAKQVLEQLQKEEQKLRKLTRTTSDARGTGVERKFLLEQYALLDCLIDKSHSISAWSKLLEFAKRKKKVADALCDKEKLSDSYLAIGESYQKLRNFSKARKWYLKSWNVSRLIGNLEGQALAKINIGNVLDSAGDWAGALESFEEGYRIATEGNIPSAQLSALENMHYSHMIRFDNVEQARKLQDGIQKLMHIVGDEDELRNFRNEYCSETETEGEELSGGTVDACNQPDKNGFETSGLSAANFVEFGDDVPLVSLMNQRKNLSRSKASTVNSHSKKKIRCPTPESLRNLDKPCSSQQHTRKRARIVISDDEDENDTVGFLKGGIHRDPMEDVATSDGDRGGIQASLSNVFEDTSHPSVSKDVVSACTPIHLEESTCSFKSRSPKLSNENEMECGSLSAAGDMHATNGPASGSKVDHSHVSGSQLHSQNDLSFHLPSCDDARARIVTFKIAGYLVNVGICSCMDGDKLSKEYVIAAVACLYYLQLPEEKMSKGLLPIVRCLKFCGKDQGVFESTDETKDHVFVKDHDEVVIERWVPKHLMRLYIDCCKKLSEEPILKLLIKLYSLEVSEDEVIVSDCGLQDVSISPFLDALQDHKTLAVLNVSHNLLGNKTMEKLHQIFTCSSQRYGGLTLDLHCNQFGPTSLFQICECPVLLARLEVLNLSENRLTDACSSYLSTILLNCKALYSLNIEQTSITSRTIQKIADALDDECALSQLFIGRNSPISGIVMVNLLSKLAALKRFSELSLSGIKLNKPMVDSLCQLARSSNLSVLMLGGTNIGSDGAMQLTDALSKGLGELVKLDLSHCGLVSQDLIKICSNTSIIGVTELSLGENAIGREGCDALASLLTDPQCCLKVLNLNKCRLGLAGVVHIIKALSENHSLEELYLSDNADMNPEATQLYDSTMHDMQTSPCKKLDLADASTRGGLEVADSEEDDGDGHPRELASSGRDGSCVSSSQRNPSGVPPLIGELLAALGSTVRPQLLDLSGNAFTEDAVEALYGAWRSSPSGSSRGGSAMKHVKGRIVHFSVEGRRCCGAKACC